MQLHTASRAQTARGTGKPDADQNSSSVLCNFTRCSSMMPYMDSSCAEHVCAACGWLWHPLGDCSREMYPELTALFHQCAIYCTSTNPAAARYTAPASGPGVASRLATVYN
jgi:hypothetical protein